MVRNPWREHRHKQLSKERRGNRWRRWRIRSMDQRHLTAKTFITDIIAEVRMTQGRVLGNLQAHGLSTIMVHATIHKDLQSQRSQPSGWPNCVTWSWRRIDWEKGKQSWQHSCRFLTILDNVLIVCESAGGEEQAGWLHSHPGSLLEEAGRGCEKSRGGHS
jgi:hypothetical protein